jgi:hypothetical protein
LHANKPLKLDYSIFLTKIAPGEESEQMSNDIHRCPESNLADPRAARSQPEQLDRARASSMPSVFVRLAALSMGLQLTCFLLANWDLGVQIFGWAVFGCLGMAAYSAAVDRCIARWEEEL